MHNGPIMERQLPPPPFMHHKMHRGDFKRIHKVPMGEFERRGPQDVKPVKEVPQVNKVAE